MVALARDLRDEFYPYLVNTENPMFQTVINLLKVQDPDQTEWTLICLAHLFKILKPILKKDFSTVFKLLLPLLDGENADYITNFAVECFAFVARDIMDKEKLLLTILMKLSNSIRDGSMESSEQLACGCGQLLFEVVRGVKEQFHSCADEYLRVYFGLLSKVKPQQSDLLYNILSGMIMVLVRHIAPVNMQTFWDACFDTLAQFRSDTSHMIATNKLLLLIGQTIENRDGKFLTNSSKFVGEMLKSVDACEMSDDCLRCISQLVTVILLSKNIILTQLDASRIIRRILTIPSAEIFEAFVWNCVNYSQFEILILPEFLRYVESKQFDLIPLELMAKIILHKAPLCGDGISINKKVYPIRLRSEKSLQKVQKILTNVQENDTFFKNSAREFLLALIIYPHIIDAEISTILAKINEQIEFCLSSLKIHDGESQTESEEIHIRNQNKRVIFILSLLVETQIHLRQLQLNCDENIVQIQAISLNNFVKKLLPFSLCESFRYVHALRVLDLVLSFEANQEVRSAEFNMDLFKVIHNSLAMNLTSRYHVVRRTTAHLFHQFSTVFQTAGTKSSIYGIFFDIESIEVTIHSYREQLLLLQRIEPTTTFLNSLTKLHEPMKLDPLKYLLGFLHVPFKLLWKPISELITVYFSEMDIEQFWSLFKAKIDETTRLQRNNHPSEICDDTEFIDGSTSLDEEYVKIWQTNERSVDLVNYRILLWRIIPSLGMLREIKNREIVTIFLDFIEHEYKRTIDRDTLTLQAQRKRKSKKMTRGRVSLEHNSEDLVDDETDEQVIDSQNVPTGTQRTLINMMQVFVNQNNPKQLHREPELWNLYMELLSHRNSDVQKLALDCVAAYKHKYIQPYIDHLRDLIDDSKYKDALTHFKIHKENGVIQPEHRPQLMPIVMRILYSKMLTRMGGQKSSNQTRKSLVMRFLGGCHEDEVLMMLNMSFWMFESEFKDDAREMCLNVSAIVPYKSNF